MEKPEIKDGQPEYNWPQLENGLEIIDELIELFGAEAESQGGTYSYAILGAPTVQMAVNPEGPFLTISRNAFDNWFVFSRLEDYLVLHQVSYAGPDYEDNIPGIIFSESGGFWRNKSLDKAVIDGIASFMADVYLNVEDEADVKVGDFDAYQPLLDILNDYFDVIARMTVRPNEHESGLYVTELDSGMFGTPPSLN